MLGSYGSALKHMNSGAKMLCEMESKEESNGSHCGLLRASTIPYVPMETLDNIFLRLNLQVSQVTYLAPDSHLEISPSLTLFR